MLFILLVKCPENLYREEPTEQVPFNAKEGGQGSNSSSFLMPEFLTETVTSFVHLL